MKFKEEMSQVQHLSLQQLLITGNSHSQTSF
jgi:hypothetical protein